MTLKRPKRETRHFKLDCYTKRLYIALKKKRNRERKLSSSVYDALIQERDEIIKRIEKHDIELATELRIVLRMLSKHASEEPKPIAKLRKVGEDSQNEFAFKDKGELPKAIIIKPVAALKKTFNDHTFKEFLFEELIYTLEQYDERGELLYKSGNLNRTAHAALRAMVKSGFIKKYNNVNGVALYKKALKNRN